MAIKGTSSGIFGHLQAYKIKVISGVNEGMKTVALWDDGKNHFEDYIEPDCVFQLNEVEVLDLV